MFDPASLRLMLVTDRRTGSRPLEEIVESALEGGVTAVMLREKDLDARALYDLARTLRASTRRHGAALLINDRADVARAAEADGVHLGWRSLPPEAARRALGPDRWIGVSAHSPEECRAAAAAGAHYVTFGPVFDTPSKAGLLAPRGLAGVATAVERLGIPLVGLGGVDRSTAGAVVAAGAVGVAVIRALAAAPDPAAAAREILFSLT